MIIWKSFNYNDEINNNEIRDFYDGLLDRAEENKYILLNTNDVDMFQDILDFYYKIRKDIAVFNKEVM